MYSSTLVQQAAVLAFLTVTANTAPTPPHFPGVAYHGVPKHDPTPFDYNITSTNGTVIGPDVPHNKSNDEGHYETHDLVVVVPQLEDIDLDDFNFTQLGQLIDAIEDTLPTNSVQDAEEDVSPSKTQGLVKREEETVVVGKPVSFPLDRSKLDKREEKVMIAGTPVSFPLDGSEE